MIDLHCHILPGIDDGAADFETALNMARMAVGDGIAVTACTPHIMPGVYDNVPFVIRRMTNILREALATANIPLKLVAGSDAHVRPDFSTALETGKVLSLNDSRYVLFEPPHNVAPPRLEDCLFGIQMTGYVPILTHPERLSWIENQYPLIARLAQAGIWMQITAGSLTGRFGKRPQYWANRMIAEGLVHILATDAHNCSSRPPLLSEGARAVAQIVGSAEATHMVVTRPDGILRNVSQDALPEPCAAADRTPQARSIWRQLIDVVRA